MEKFKQVDKEGRITIPKEMRERLGNPRLYHLTLEDGKITVKNGYEFAKERAGLKGEKE